MKPIIIVLDGEVNNLAKERTRRKAVARLRLVVEEFSPLDSVAVMYSTSRDEADRLAADVESLVTSDESPTVVQFGPRAGYIRRAGRAWGLTADRRRLTAFIRRADP